jgi:predicted nucleotidyltransferase
MDFDTLDVDSENILLKIDFQSPMYYANITPEPDEKTISSISYTKSEKWEEIYKNGIYIYAESLSNKRRFEGINSILIIVIGSLAALLLQKLT